jgi:DNA-binding response OmpR family regulator
LIFAFDNYVLDTERRELRRRHTVVSVQPQVFDLLEYLIRNRGRRQPGRSTRRYLGRAHRFRINARHPHQRSPQRDR